MSIISEISAISRLWRFKIVLRLGAGRNGAWTVTRNDEDTRPHFDDNRLIYQDHVPDNGYGASATGAVKNQSLPNTIMNSPTQLPRIDERGINSIMDRLTELSEGLARTIIMPAGKTSSLTGIDTDTSGNLYTQLTY